MAGAALQGGTGTAAVPGVAQAGGTPNLFGGGLGSGSLSVVTANQLPTNSVQGVALPGSSPAPAPKSTALASVPAPAGGSPAPAAPSSASIQNQITSSVSQAQTDAAAQAQAEQQRQQALQDQMKAGINSQWNDTYSFLDQQAGLLPQQRAELEGKVNDIIGTQKQGVAQGVTDANQVLDRTQAQEDTNTQSGLRDLEQNAQSLLQANRMHLSNLGSDSSAVNYSNELLDRGISRDRTSFLNSRNAVSADIGTKRLQVQQTANQQNSQIEQWKAQQLLSLADEFQQKQDQINQMRHGADQDKQKDLNNMTFQLGTDLNQRLRSLDDQVTSFKQGLSSWQVQNDGQLRNALDQIKAYTAGTAAYQSPTLAPYLTDNPNGTKSAYTFNPQTGQFTGAGTLGGNNAIPLGLGMPNASQNAGQVGVMTADQLQGGSSGLRNLQPVF